MNIIIIVWSMINLFLTISSTNETDRLSLLAFKHQITYDPLGALSSWNHSLHHCQWNGVTCSSRHRDRVSVLYLKSQKLEGTLSPHVGNLTFLRKLTLTMNNFHGEIPQEISHLFQLRFLFLNKNSFTGNILTNLTRCPHLRAIDMRKNKLSGKIPTEFTSLTRLESLDLGQNELKGTIPPSLGNLSSLTILSLTDDSLVGSIPNDLCRIQGLNFFDVSTNLLNGILPSCFFNLSQLEIFGVIQNKLEGSLPPGIGLSIPNLKGLYMAGNNFSGIIPLSLCNASELGTIELSGNKFTGQVPSDLGRLQELYILSIHSNHLGSKYGNDLEFITSLTNCSKLFRFSISYNSFKGPIPNSIGNLSTQMTLLYLGTNLIHGSIPAGMESLFNLAVLEISYTYLSGEIPNSIGMFSKMHHIYLSHNHFSGQIPDSLGNLTSLEILVLRGNELDGRIPTSLGECKNLRVLDLSNNNLNGTIPKQVIGLSSLKYVLNLSHNDLSGSLPSEVGNLSDLQLLDVSRNRLVGYIPNTLGNCLTLEYLSVASNFFCGNIPESLRSLKGLELLNLSNNKLAGKIPQYLQNFTSLNYLDLSYNELEGLVLEDGVFANASNISIVGNSKLCGGVAELKLFPCRMTQINKKGKSPSLKVVLPVIAGSLCFVLLTCFLYTCYRRKLSKTKPFLPSFFNHQYTRISYAELLKATNSFCGDNLIGTGSYGSVYKGILPPNNTVIAVKVFNVQQRGAFKSFLSECNTMKNLRHRNLLRIITSCSSIDFKGNDFKALIFEFMPNRSLEEWLHHNPETSEQNGIRSLSFLERLGIAIDIGSALDYLHNHCQPAIIHCDLKPSNVLLDGDMTAHVADFGLATIFSAASHNFSQSEGSSLVVKGSIGYVAPEYGIGGEVSFRGDIYSYGILLLEMFTGQRPTSDKFQDGKNLYSFAKMALPEQLMNIVDPGMLLENSDEPNMACQSERRVRMQECLVSTIRLGVTCSGESPNERMNIGEVVTELYHIKDHHLGVRVPLQ